MAKVYIYKNGLWYNACDHQISFFKNGIWKRFVAGSKIRANNQWMLLDCTPPETQKAGWSIDSGGFFMAGDDFYYEIQYMLNRNNQTITQYGGPNLPQYHEADLGTEMTIQWNDRDISVVLNGQLLRGDGSLFNSRHTFTIDSNFSIIINPRG